MARLDETKKAMYIAFRDEVKVAREKLLLANSSKNIDEELESIRQLMSEASDLEEAEIRILMVRNSAHTVTMNHYAKPQLARMLQELVEYIDELIS